MIVGCVEVIIYQIIKLTDEELNKKMSGKALHINRSQMPVGLQDLQSL